MLTVENIYMGYGWIGIIAAIIAAKWAMELGFSQARQLLWAIAGFVLPPLALLALYVRLLRQADRRHAAITGAGR